MLLLLLLRVLLWQHHRSPSLPPSPLVPFPPSSCGCSGLKYETGDHVGVYARNSEDVVERVAALLRLPVDTMFTLYADGEGAWCALCCSLLCCLRIIRSYIRPYAPICIHICPYMTWARSVWCPSHPAAPAYSPPARPYRPLRRALFSRASQWGPGPALPRPTPPWHCAGLLC